MASVIEKTLSGVTGSLDRTLFTEDVARQPGSLQRLDPRVKLVGLLGLLLAVSLARSLWVILAAYALVLALAWMSRVPMSMLVKQVWIALPFFTGLIAIPTLFITPGAPLITLWFDPVLVITQQGLRSAAFLVLRVGASMSIALLLVLTTPWNTLLRALNVLRVPAVFILILGMTYRYIHLLLRLAGDMFQARQSRVVGRMPAGAQRRVVTNTMGTLLGKSYDLSQDVYLAMLSRGFRGSPRSLDHFAMTSRDWAWGTGLVAAALLLMWLGR